MTLASRIRAAALDNLTYAEIVKATGADIETVRRVVRRFKKRLAIEAVWSRDALGPALLELAGRRGRPPKPAKAHRAPTLAALAPAPATPRERLLAMPDRVYRLLRAEGVKRGLDAASLAHELLRVAAEDNLFNAVLGDIGDNHER